MLFIDYFFKVYTSQNYSIHMTPSGISQTIAIIQMLLQYCNNTNAHTY